MPRSPPPMTSLASYGDRKDKAAIYSGTIDNTDRAIARLLEKLQQVAPPENTLIIYASDNGSYRDDRTGGLRGRKGLNWEGGIRVPGIFSWPGTIPAGRRLAEPAGLVDVLPTVCGLLDLDPPAGTHLDGSRPLRSPARARPNFTATSHSSGTCRNLARSSPCATVTTRSSPIPIMNSQPTTCSRKPGSP